jgi:hypothetical protein
LATRQRNKGSSGWLARAKKKASDGMPLIFSRAAVFRGELGVGELILRRSLLIIWFSPFFLFLLWPLYDWNMTA